jgi:hypothetical protein
VRSGSDRPEGCDRRVAWGDKDFGASAHQALAEFGDDLEIVSVGRDGERRWTLAELLPDSFSGGDLPV